MIKQRIRGINNETIGYMVADVIGTSRPYKNFVSIGMSVCNKLDKPDKIVGQILAINRQKNYTEPYTIKDTLDDKYFRPSIGDQLNYFVNRCYRYYKDKSIIVPKVDFT